MKGSLFAIFVTALSVIVPSASVGSKEKLMKVAEECAKKTGFKLEDIPKAEKSFEDKCYGKCVLTDLGFLKDLKFQRDLIKADIVDSNPDKKLQEKIKVFTLACLDTAEKAAGTLSEKNICKAADQFLACCAKAEEKTK